jgi:hypothetical protein
MKIRTSFLIALLALAAVLPSQVAAQDLTGDRVRAALERTDLRIELATSVVAGANNAQARLELDAAVSLQAQAKEIFSQGLVATGEVQLRLFRRALDLTLRARAHADKAISLIQGLPDPERILAQLERTRELIERARDRIAECDNDRARALLKVAVEMQARAEAAANESRYLAALQLTLGARERALRALRMCNQEERLEESSDRALRRTDEAIARAKDVVGERGSERVRELLGRAVRLQAEAWAQFRADHLEASLRMTLSARNMAQRAIRATESAR